MNHDIFGDRVGLFFCDHGYVSSTFRLSRISYPIRQLIASRSAACRAASAFASLPDKRLWLIAPAHITAASAVSQMMSRMVNRIG